MALSEQQRKLVQRARAVEKPFGSGIAAIDQTLGDTARSMKAAVGDALFDTVFPKQEYTEAVGGGKGLPNNFAPTMIGSAEVPEIFSKLFDTNNEDIFKDRKLSIPESALALTDLADGIPDRLIAKGALKSVPLLAISKPKVHAKFGAVVPNSDLQKMATPDERAAKVFSYNLEVAPRGSKDPQGQKMYTDMEIHTPQLNGSKIGHLASLGNIGGLRTTEVAGKTLTRKADTSDSIGVPGLFRLMRTVAADFPELDFLEFGRVGGKKGGGDGGLPAIAVDLRQVRKNKGGVRHALIRDIADGGTLKNPTRSEIDFTNRKMADATGEFDSMSEMERQIDTAFNDNITATERIIARRHPAVFESEAVSERRMNILDAIVPSGEHEDFITMLDVNDLSALESASEEDLPRVVERIFLEQNRFNRNHSNEPLSEEALRALLLAVEND